MERQRRDKLLLALGAALLLAVVAILALFDWNWFKGPIQRAASARLGREVSLSGPLRVKLWSSAPTITVTRLRIGNPAWESNKRPFVEIERVQAQLDLHALVRGHLVLRRLELVHPRIYLHQEQSGRANWTFANDASPNSPSPKPTKLPAIRDLVIDAGELVLNDELRRLRIEGTVQAHEQSYQPEGKPFRVDGRGSINREPFRLEIAGGPLLAISPERPYPFSLAIKAGENNIDATGRVEHPFDMAGLDLQLTAGGHDLAELYYLTQLALPNTPPYQVRAHITRDGQRFAVRDIKGSLGRSDISGQVDVDVSRKRPAIDAKLTSRHLLLADLGAVTGSRAGGPASLDSGSPTVAGARSTRGGTNDPGRLFPNAHLQADRVRAMDAKLQFSANSIEAGTVPLSRLRLKAALKNGVLTVEPFDLEMPQGHLAGLVHLDARQDVPQVRVDLHLRDLQLNQLKGKTPNAAAPLDGLMQARLIIEGSGDSVRDLMAHANGSLTAVVPQGEIRSAFAELAGIDVAEGIGLLLKKPDDRAAIRCGIARFDLVDGIAHAQTFVIDTQNVVITGGGEVELGTEQLDMTIKGKPKKVRLVRLRTPIKLEGHLLQPKFALEPGHLLKQGAIGAALATVVTPVAALLAFVDPGLAKDQNCAQLLAPAEPSMAPAATAELDHP
jgi:hypothetical protein